MTWVEITFKSTCAVLCGTGVGMLVTTVLKYYGAI